jgi:hypothetical protein
MVVLVTTDRPRYDEDQPVVVAVEVCNRDATPHRYAVARGQEVVVTIVDEGGRQVAADLPPATGSGTDEWEPGQCRSYGPFRWWQEWNHFDGTRAHGFPQPDAGRYAAVGAYTGNAAEPVVEPGRAPFELNGVTVVVSTDRPSYAAGELVTATARVCNPFDRAEVETIVWQPEAVLRIHRDGYTIAQVHESGPVEPFPLPFAPRQCRDYRYVWDQRAEVWDPGTEDGRPSGGRVPPGTYSVEVLWWGHDHDRVGKGADARPGIVPDRLPFELR